MKFDVSPWGVVQDQKILADGIVWVSTPSHGGVWVSPDRLDKMPIKQTAYSQGGWFEEDCDWALVAVTFPEAFSERDVATAKSIVSRYFPNMEVTG